MLRTRRSRVLTGSLAAPLALLWGAAVIHLVSALAAEPRRDGHQAQQAPQRAAAAAASSTAPQSADQLPSQDSALIDTVRDNLERLIATQEKLRAEITSLGADLASEKSRASQHLSERDEALRRAEEAAAVNARLEAQAKTAQDALALEQERSRKLQEQAEAAIQELQSRLTAALNERDDLQNQLAKLSAARPAPNQTKPTGTAATQRTADETAPPSATHEQPAEKPAERMAALDGGERSGLADHEPQKSDNQDNATSSAIASQLCLAVNAGQTTLSSTDQEISALRSRLQAAAAALEGLRNDTAHEQTQESLSNASLQALQNLIERRSVSLSEADGAVGDLSRDKPTLISAFESLQGEVGALGIEKGEIDREIAALERANAEAIEAFGTIRKKTVELETAAEVLSIRQELNDFKTGQIRGAALAQHESMLATTVTNLDSIASDITTATTMRARLAAQAESLQARLQKFTAKFADVNERVGNLPKRTDAWLHQVASHRIAPLDDVTSALAEIREGAARDATAVAASAALVERLKETRQSLEDDLGSISETLGALNTSLRAVVTPLEGSASVGDGAHDRPATALAAGECRDRAQLLKDVDEVRQGLEARLVEVTGLTELADRVTRDLASASEAASRAEGDLAVLRQQHKARLDQIEILSNQVASLNTAWSTHDQRLSAETERIAALAGRLNELTEKLASTDREVRAYGSETVALAVDETGDAEAIQRRVNTLADRVGLFKAAVVSLKRPPPVPAKPPRSAATAPISANEQPMSPARAADKVEASCNIALPSCRRWHHLRKQQSQNAGQEAAQEQPRERN